MSKRRDPNRPVETSDRRYRKPRARFRAECERLNAVCHLCGDTIRYDLPDGTHADSFTLDHFYPRSKRPELALDPANWRAAHSDCNKSRGDDDVRETLGVPSEDW